MAPITNTPLKSAVPVPVVRLRRTPSKGASAFTEWFTAHYDGIAQERLLTPPPESGITGPVPVFAELRRISLLTAIAERLRDQGVPLPFWMRDYPVRTLHFEETTPALRVERNQGTWRVSIFGGVSLSAPTAEVRSLTQVARLATLPAGQRAAARERLENAATLSQAVSTQVTAPQPLTVLPLSGQGAGYQAVALPGAESRALAPAIIVAHDLAIPIGGGQEIRLTRRFHSFFAPDGPWGRGWALDLPRLETLRVPEQREAKGAVTYRRAYELVTPLNTTYARFARLAEVPELNGARLRVPDQPGEFLGQGEAQPDFLTVATHKVIRKDGEAWHFGEDGALLAAERGGYRTVYERDARGRVMRIIGLQGSVSAARITLSYDEASGRVQAAEGRRETGRSHREGDVQSVRYEYDAEGRLAAVASAQGRTGYRYAGTRVAAVTCSGAPAPGGPAVPEATLRAFEYGPRGQLLAETDAAGNRTEYRIGADATGHQLALASGGSGGESVRYDPAFRPLAARFADGVSADWSYPPEGGLSMALVQPDGSAVRLTQSADGTERTLEGDGGRRLVGRYDRAGRLISLSDDGRPVLRQEWRPDGRLGLAVDETTAARAAYDPAGLLTRLLLTPPQERDSANPRTWQSTELDPAGRPRKITDFRGLEVTLDYDAAGDLAGISTRREGQDYGYRLNRDEAGRIRDLQSSWGSRHYDYDREGRLERLDMNEGGARSSIAWEAGRPTHIRQFDGGESSIAYYRGGGAPGLPQRIITPASMALNYGYDGANRLETLDLGGESRLRLAYDTKGRLAAWVQTPAGP